MRLLQLTLRPDLVLELHPNVSIITGIDDEHRSVLLEAVAGLARAEAVAASGLLEAHGVLFELDQELLDAIGAPAGELDPIVRPTQVPARPESVTSRELRLREQELSLLQDMLDSQARANADAHAALRAATEEVAAARRALDESVAHAHSTRADLERLGRRAEEIDEEIPGIVEELSVARRERDLADGAVADLEHVVTQRRAEVEEASTLRESTEAELADIDARNSADLSAEVERAREHLRAVESEVEQANTDADLASSEREDARRLAELDGRIAELERLLSVITPVERLDLEGARDRLVGCQSTDLVASPEAEEIAAALDRVDAEVVALGPDGSNALPDGAMAQGRSRLDDARQALLEAEQALRSRNLDPVVVERLEEVHAEVSDASDRSVGRFSKGRGMAAKLESLRQEEETLLASLGFASYTSYLLGYSSVTADPEAEAAVEARRAELAAAEERWRELERATEVVLASATLLDERRVLLRRAHELLGHVESGTSPQQALRALRVSGSSVESAAASLQAELEGLGMALDDEDLDHAELLELAEVWLEESDRVDHRRREAIEELEQLQRERDGLGEGLDAPSPEHDEAAAQEAAAAEANNLARVVSARAQLADAERHLAETLEAGVHRVSLEADLVAARQIEDAALLELDAAMVRLRDAEEAQRQLRDRVAALDEELDRAHRELGETRATVVARAAEVEGPQAPASGLERAEQAHARSLAAAEREDQLLEEVKRRRAAATARVDALRTSPGESSTVSAATPAEELEWYLLARLASLRSASVAGSVPVLLDEALGGLASEHLPRILEMLEHMAEAVQVIILSEDPVVAEWASSVGLARAAVVGLSAA